MDDADAAVSRLDEIDMRRGCQTALDGSFTSMARKNRSEAYRTICNANPSGGWDSAIHYDYGMARSISKLGAGDGCR